eukprot:4658346-Prorocentrum_lima.AAC.1
MKGHHSLTCNHGPHRKHRHEQVKDTIGTWLKEQGFSCQVEDPTTHVHTRGDKPDLDRQPEAWMDIIAKTHTNTYYIDVTIILSLIHI